MVPAIGYGASATPGEREGLTTAGSAAICAVRSDPPWRDSVDRKLAAASGTVWGLLNACTEFVDHARRARSQDYRLDSPWFGQGAAIKGRAFEKAVALIA